MFRFRHTVFYSHLNKVGDILTKSAALRINLNIDDTHMLQDRTLTPHTLKPLAFSPRPSP